MNTLNKATPSDTLQKYSLLWSNSDDRAFTVKLQANERNVRLTKNKVGANNFRVQCNKKWLSVINLNWWYLHFSCSTFCTGQQLGATVNPGVS